MPAQFINVLIAFDAETILDKYTKQTSDPKNPTSTDGSEIYMTVRASNAVSGQAGGNLEISAHPGDIIRWRETTMSLNTQYSVLLYHYEGPGGSNLITDPELRHISTRWPVLKSVDDPAFDNNDPVKDFYWESTVQEPSGNPFNYHFSFELIEGGNAIGYYSWDPSIIVNPS